MILVPNPDNWSIVKPVLDKDMNRVGLYYVMTLGKTTIGLSNAYSKIPELQMKATENEIHLIRYAYSQWKQIEAQRIAQEQNQKSR